MRGHSEYISAFNVCSWACAGAKARMSARPNEDHYHRSAEGLVRAAREILTRRDAAIIDRFPTISERSIVIAAADDRPFLTDYVAKEIPGAKKVNIPDVLQRCNPCTDFIALHGSGTGTGRASSASQQLRQLSGGTTDPQ